MGLFDKVVEKAVQGMDVAKNADNKANTEGMGGDGVEINELYLKQKITLLADKYSIYDGNETPVYDVKGTVTGLNYKVSTASGAQVAEIKKKLVAVTPTYDIEVGGRKISMKKKIALLKESFTGTFDGKELNVNGDVAGFAFDIVVDGQKIGSVAKKILAWADTYAIAYVGDEWRDAVVAIVVAIDNACHKGD